MVLVPTEHGAILHLCQRIAKPDLAQPELIYGPKAVAEFPKTSLVTAAVVIVTRGGPILGCPPYAPPPRWGRAKRDSLPRTIRKLDSEEDS